MIGKAADVAAYIEEAPADRRAPIEQLRSLCRQNLTGYEECMEFGIPSYKRNGSREFSLASQKQCALATIGKSCIDFAIIAQLLRHTKATPGCSC
jgi:hypothetical protein